MNGYNGTIALAIAAALSGAILTGPTAIAAAQNLNTAGDLSNLATVEEYALATDGTYSTDLTALTSGTYSYTVKPTTGTSIGVSVDPVTNEYLIVGVSSSGTYVYRGSDYTGSVEGESEFDPAAAAEVTSNVKLFSSPPEMTRFAEAATVEASR
jgi:hypothetical protein